MNLQNENSINIQTIAITIHTTQKLHSVSIVMLELRIENQCYKISFQALYVLRIENCNQT